MNAYHEQHTPIIIIVNVTTHMTLARKKLDDEERSIKIVNLTNITSTIKKLIGTLFLNSWGT